MILADFTIKEFDSNFKELSDIYEKVKSLEAIKVFTPLWNDKKIDPVSQIHRMFTLIEQRYKSARTAWFDVDGKVKLKYRQVLVNFFGTMQWFAFRLERVYNENASQA